ncbi:hypothetical protein A3B45_01845 [Candidatus Daviesbacteria bacterium RIFCSPLOWO2_01_FULL_39_12]|uniref:DNA polymerase III delta N-terminal domain-containing protein n=1 Tax=Candidatus Daviesbacteria bacterium RIFCSPLOWO2_01_FULL_39_12 TaxID=1797785 RepID=A0A1F5KLZ0_9BACT|nr:MAG: hypothetical protein A3D79_01000 [Candidatus Daviesbacteria bacterium RIFCSPHIGHO2_02_FULL_39_8]OGE41943.1 MAG: hypothetical protein A3B45_01845 [Candidatus Daviesbacteria bacterium RIFCSPLOWO2_01_FULL_39_12]
MIARVIISLSLRERVKEIEKILLEYNLSLNHPDLLYFTGDVKIGIAEARRIKDHFAYKSFRGKIKATVLEDASQMSLEAQNALLKTLEELPTDGLFILGADSDSKLLPTVLSRCQIIKLQGTSRQGSRQAGDREQVGDYQEDIEKLLNSSIEERFAYIEKLKDREEFLKFMVQYFHQQLTEPATHTRPGLARLEFLKELLQAEEWQKQNVNLRAILEYLMLVMPKVV